MVPVLTMVPVPVPVPVPIIVPVPILAPVPVPVLANPYLASNDLPEAYTTAQSFLLNRQLASLLCLTVCRNNQRGHAASLRSAKHL